MISTDGSVCAERHGADRNHAPATSKLENGAVFIGTYPAVNQPGGLQSEGLVSALIKLPLMGHFYHKAFAFSKLRPLFPVPSA